MNAKVLPNTSYQDSINTVTGKSYLLKQSSPVLTRLKHKNKLFLKPKYSALSHLNQGLYTSNVDNTGAIKVKGRRGLVQLHLKSVSTGGASGAFDDLPDNYISSIPLLIKPKTHHHFSKDKLEHKQEGSKSINISIR